MSRTNSDHALQQYSSTAVQSGVGGASPHRLIQMLMDGALEKIATARGAMLRGDVALKGKHVGWAISIVEGLRTSLDKSSGGEIAEHLDDLYEYMERRLLEANRTNDAEMLDEVAGLLREIKSAWDAIPPEIQDRHAAADDARQKAVTP